MNNEAIIEQKIQNKNLDAPRITPERIESVIDHAEYHVFTNKLTVCCIHLVNGFTVTGESACVDPRNYNRALGEEIAWNKARQKVWGLEAYLLQQEQHIKVKNEFFNNEGIPI